MDPGASAQKGETFMVRVINPQRKKCYETYLLHDITKEMVRTPLQLKKELVRLLNSAENLVSPESIGYMKGSAKLSIRSCDDIEDIWASVSKGEKITLWCYKAIESIADDAIGSDSNDISRKSKGKRKCKVFAMEEKNERIEAIITSLCEKHAMAYTIIQYRLWVEMMWAHTSKCKSACKCSKVFD